MREIGGRYGGLVQFGAGDGELGFETSNLFCEDLLVCSAGHRRCILGLRHGERLQGRSMAGLTVWFYALVCICGALTKLM